MTTVRLAALAAASALASAGATAQVTQPGSYEARFCVSNPASAPPSCGAAAFTVHAPGRATLQVFDIEYRFRLRRSQLDVTLTQGTVQIDEFTTDYAWRDGALVFDDAPKNVRYAIRPEAKPR